MNIRKNLQHYIHSYNYVSAHEMNSDYMELENAVSGKLESLMTYGKCIQRDGIEPTPDLPLNITCNNGVILNVTKNLFNLTPGNIISGYWINNEGIETASQSDYVYGSYIPVKPDTMYVFYGRRKSDSMMSSYNRIAWYDSDFQWISNSIDTEGTIISGMSPHNAAYARPNCNTYGNDIPITYENVVDFNWMFYEGEMEEAYVPNGIVTNDDKESVIVTGKNLFNKNEIIAGYIDSQGNLIEDNAFAHSNLIPVKTGATYVFSGTRLIDDTDKTIQGYNANGTWVQQLAIDSSSTAEVGGYYLTTTIPSGVSYAVISGMRTGIKADEFVQFEKSIRPTKYENYTKEIYRMPPLLSIDDMIRDTFDLTSGLLRHNVGIKSLTGNENWVFQQENNAFYMDDIVTPNISLPNNGVICTHFAGRIASSVDISNVPDLSIKWGSSTTHGLYIKYNGYNNVNDFKQWLASEYSAGTPVIVLYQTEIELEENYGKRSFYTVTGTNYIERFARDINNLEMEVTYKRLR